MCKAKTLNSAFVKKYIKPRNKDCHKGDFGSALIIASCNQMSGAAAISSLSALRSGAGLVFTASTNDGLISTRTNVPEAVLLPLKESSDGKISYENLALLLEKSEKMSSVLIGCGLSVSEDTKKLVNSLLESVTAPIVLDADGINIVCENIDILRGTKAPLILTPHLKEMSRLIKKDVSYIKENMLKIALEFSKEFNLTLVLKDFETVIAHKGQLLFINRSGHPCMAKGGSGDMLSGIIVALLAQGLSPEIAASCGVYLHAKAGEICGKKLGDFSVITRDMIAALPKVFKKFC